MNTKDQVRERLKTLLIDDPAALAAWEGGSAATGFLDDFSDLDLVIVCEDEAVEVLFHKIEAHLENTYGIQRRYRVAEPAWHGFSQCFYKISQVPELFYLDIALIKQSIPNKFTESDRHGNALVWFEKTPVIDPTPTPADKVAEKGRHFFKMVTQSDFLIITEIEKALARNNFTEAFPRYYQFVSNQLGVLLNLKYRPCKVDFGLRYAYRDFEDPDVKLLTYALQVSSVDVLREKFKLVLHRYNQLNEELKGEWS